MSIKLIRSATISPLHINGSIDRLFLWRADPRKELGLTQFFFHYNHHTGTTTTTSTQAQSHTNDTASENNKTSICSTNQLQPGPVQMLFLKHAAFNCLQKLVRSTTYSLDGGYYFDDAQSELKALLTCKRMEILYFGGISWHIVPWCLEAWFSLSVSCLFSLMQYQLSSCSHGEHFVLLCLL